MLSFLVPLYLVDIQGLGPAQLGGLLMIGAGTMALVVRLAGGMADRWSSRWLVVAGLAVQMSVMLIFSRLPGDVPLGGVNKERYHLFVLVRLDDIVPLTVKDIALHVNFIHLFGGNFSSCRILSPI